MLSRLIAIILQCITNIKFLCYTAELIHPFYLNRTCEKSVQLSFCLISQVWSWVCQTHSTFPRKCSRFLGMLVISTASHVFSWVFRDGKKWTQNVRILVWYGQRILQARILEWVTRPSSRGCFRLGNRTQGLPHCRQIPDHLSHQGSPYAQGSSDPVKLCIRQILSIYGLVVWNWNKTNTHAKTLQCYWIHLLVLPVCVCVCVCVWFEVEN